MRNVAHAEGVAATGGAFIPIANRVSRVHVAKGALLRPLKTPHKLRIGGFDFDRANRSSGGRHNALDRLFRKPPRRPSNQKRARTADNPDCQIAAWLRRRRLWRCLDRGKIAPLKYGKVRSFGDLEHNRLTHAFFQEVTLEALPKNARFRADNTVLAGAVIGRPAKNTLTNEDFSNFVWGIGELPVYHIQQKITKPDSALKFFARENSLDQRAAFLLGRIPRHDY